MWINATMSSSISQATLGLALQRALQGHRAYCDKGDIFQGKADLLLGKQLVNLFDKCHEFYGVLLHCRLFREYSPALFVFALHYPKKL
jgi:hypothetical protein